MLRRYIICLTALFFLSIAACSSGDDESPPAAGCGGIAGLPCAHDSEYCRFEPGTCGEFDLLGVCEPLPEICTQEYAPVCGCDSTTYGNACAAAAAGVSIRVQGECGRS